MKNMMIKVRYKKHKYMLNYISHDIYNIFSLQIMILILILPYNNSSKEYLSNFGD